jgi:putative transcriptional regulator
VKNLLAHIRRKKNIKQNDMAMAVNVSPSYLCKIETGAQQPTGKFKKACSRYLGMPENALFPDNIDPVKINTINRTFKNKLWSARKEKGIMQYELAKLLDCSPSYLSKVEKGLQEPTVKFKKKCAMILKIKEAELFS